MHIPGYRIERLLGKGGMATVYLAVQQSLDRRVALKLMHGVGDDAAIASERFFNEGRLIAALAHPNIVTVHDIGVAGTQHFLSMEYVSGGDLRSRAAQRMAPAPALSVARAIAAALGHAHAAGVIHRDVKPANVLFREDGTPLVSDFGIAKSLGRNGDLTVTGSVLGSPRYLSPEQAFGKELDARSDIYSLGIVLYQMLLGEAPFRADSDVATIFMHLNEPLPRLPPRLRHLQDLLDGMTAKQPDDRYPHTPALIEALEAATLADTAAPDGPSPLSGPGLCAREASPRLRRPGRRRSTVLSAAAVAAAGIALAAALPRSPPPAAPAGERAQVSASGTPGSSPSPAHPEEPAASSKHPVSAPAAPSAVRPETEPDPRTRRVSALLASADAAARAGRWVAPPGSNARDLYREVLGMEPKNVQARKGLDALAERFAAAGQRHLEQGDLTAAAEATSAGLAIRPGGERLLALRREVETRREIEARLNSARRALDEYRLTTPHHDSAYHYYQEVLALDPAQPAALRGLNEIAERYAALARREISAYDYTEARALIDRGLVVRPGHPALRSLRDQARLSNAPKQAWGDLKRLLE